MRKKIGKYLTFEKLRGMDCHEILKAMGFDIKRDVPESKMESDARSFRISREFRDKCEFSDLIGIDWRLNLVTLLDNVRTEFEITNLDWRLFRFIAYNDMREGYNVFTRNAGLIDRDGELVRIGYDEDAFCVSGGWNVIDYSMIGLNDAREHLDTILGRSGIFTGVFCTNHLIEEIAGVADYFERSDNKFVSCWYKAFKDKFNGCLRTGNKGFDVYIKGREKYIRRSDYVLFLMMVKYMYRFKETSIIKSYLESDIPKDERDKVLKIFIGILSYVDQYPSICPEENLFALNNYFKDKYVRDTDETEKQVPCDSFDDGQSLKDLIRYALKSGKITVNINIGKNNE